MNRSPGQKFASPLYIPMDISSLKAFRHRGRNFEQSGEDATCSLEAFARRVAPSRVSALAAALAAPQAMAADVTVFAAASLKNALDDDQRRLARPTPARSATISYAASSALAKQIEQGAPADVFFSADLDWMDYLVRSAT